MLAKIVHRGPDDGFVTSDGGATLGARRLSIIDLAGGRQPLRDETGNFIASQNGEIYNFHELTGSLQSAGHRFSTTCDTEVLAHAYDEYGPSFGDRLVGMFAAAVWDVRRRRGVLIRDRVGKKPLYYFQSPSGAVWYASEIKALMAVPGAPREINPAALHHYLGYKHVPHDSMIYLGLRCVPPGGRVEVELRPDGRAVLVEKQYFTPSFVAEVGDPSGEEEWVERLTDSLRSAVRRRLMSDVPIGFFLSGGVDSSLVTALAAQEAGARIRTFTLAYDEQSTTEGKELDRRCARLVADRYGTEHHEEVISMGDLADDLPRILSFFDEPFAGVTSTFYLSKLIARHVKVALSGDGADELFGSYLTHRLAIPIHRWLQGERDPGRLAPFGNEQDRLRDLAHPDPAVWKSKLLVFPESEKRALYSPEWRARAASVLPTEDHLRGYFHSPPLRDPLNAVLEAEFLSQLPDQVLAFVDRLSMAHSLEVRCPFLDQEFVRLASRAPGELKMKGGEVKYLLKRVAQAHLPRESIDRPKEGFLMPVSRWLQGGLRGFMLEMLSKKNLERHGIFDIPAVESLIRRFEAGDASLAIRIYVLVAFQVWFNNASSPVAGPA